MRRMHRAASIHPQESDDAGGRVIFGPSCTFRNPASCERAIGPEEKGITVKNPVLNAAMFSARTTSKSDLKLRKKLSKKYCWHL
jgi:hypothetical protein